MGPKKRGKVADQASSGRDTARTSENALQNSKINGIMSRKNRLGDMLSQTQAPVQTHLRTQNQTQNQPQTHSNTQPKRRKFTKRLLRQFEEDEGFKFKRSQDEMSITTPISRLNQELLALSDDDSVPLFKSYQQKKRRVVSSDDDIDDLLDFQAGSRNKPRSGGSAGARGSKSKETGAGKRQTKKFEELALSSPIRSPEIEEIQRKPAPSTRDSGRNGRELRRAATSGKIDYSVDLSDEDYDDNGHDNGYDNGNGLYVEEVSMVPLAEEPAAFIDKRRSSYYQRGKRILSIGNGFEGVPHDDVSPLEYYKLLSPQLPEPRRMRQLLIWCFRRKLSQEALGRKSSSGGANANENTVFSIAKVIKEEVLRDLTDGQIETTWYNIRNTQEGGLQTKVYKSLPNPANKTIKDNLEICKTKLRALETEAREWERVQKEYASNMAVSKFPPVEVNSAEPTPTISKGDELVKGLETSLSNIEDLPNSIENSIDKFSNTAYRLLKGYELIKSLQHEKLSSQVAGLVKDCIFGGNKVPETAESLSLSSNANLNSRSRNPTASGNGDAVRTPTWAAPRLATTKELLRGIARLDAR